MSDNDDDVGGGDGIDAVIDPPVDVEEDDDDALVPDNDGNSDVNDDDADEWPRYLNACFDDDCKYREVQPYLTPKIEEFFVTVVE